MHRPGKVKAVRPVQDAEQLKSAPAEVPVASTNEYSKTAAALQRMQFTTAQVSSTGVMGKRKGITSLPSSHRSAIISVLSGAVQLPAPSIPEE